MGNRLPYYMLTVALGLASVASSIAAPPAAPVQPEHVVLFVLEGFGKDSLKTGSMPAVSKLVKKGSVTWSATGVNPPLPIMTSLRTQEENRSLRRSLWPCVQWS